MMLASRGSHILTPVSGETRPRASFEFPMLGADWSYGEILPGSAGSTPNPYTTVHPNAIAGAPARKAKSAGSRNGCGIGRASVGGSGSEWGAAGRSVHRVMAVSQCDAVGFLDFQARNEAVVNPLTQGCGSGTRRLAPRLQAQAGRFTQLPGYGFTGCNVGCSLHGLLHLREGACGGRNRLTVACACAIDSAPGAGSVQAASRMATGGPAAKGLAAAIDATLVCKRQARGLARRRVLRSIADTQVFPRRPTMEDTTDMAVCQTKDFTILRPMLDSIISIGVSFSGESDNQYSVS